MRARRLRFDLPSACALPGHNLELIVGVSGERSGLLSMLLTGVEGVGVVGAGDDNVRSQTPQTGELGIRRRRGNEDRRPVAQYARRVCDGKTEISS